MAIISKRFAQGLRRFAVKREREKLDEFNEQLFEPGAFLVYIKKNACLLHEKRRGPRHGLAAGSNVVWVDHSTPAGQLWFFSTTLDKKGNMALVENRSSTLLMKISNHAVESLYQRLHTTNEDQVIVELAALGKMLSSDPDPLGTCLEGLLLTPQGLFPVVRGDPIVDPDMIANCYCVATTWISWDGLEDHTAQKRRLAEAARKARAQGLTFTTY